MAPAERKALDPRDTCSGCLGHGPCVDPASHGRAMGPIERELRDFDDADRVIFESSPEAYRCYFDAWVCLGGELFGHPQADETYPDIMSEAIEAAEALGL